MGTDFNIKPVGAPVAAPFIRPAPEAARNAVATQLPQGQSVTATDASLRANASASSPQQADDNRISREVVIDRDSASLVFVSVDSRTSEVVNQFPDASRLRARAYLRAQDETRLEDRRLATDRRA